MLNKMKLLRRLAVDKSGVALALTAVTIIGVLGFAGLAVDVGVWYSTARSVQVAADAAALAGAFEMARTGSTTAEIQQATTIAAAKNGYSTATGATVAVTIAPGNADIQVRISTPAPLFFSSLFISDNPVISGVAAAAPKTGSMELALVLDVSGSMNRTGKIDVLRTATQDMMDILYGSAETLPNTWVAVLPFSGRVNIRDYGTTWMRNPGGGDAGHLCVGLRNRSPEIDDSPPSVELFPDFVDPGLERRRPRSNCPDAKAMGLTAEKTVVKTLLASLTTAFATSTHRGMVWAWRAISPDWQGLWADPNLPNPWGGSIPKVVVIMTDGRNTSSLAGDPYSSGQADDILLQECNDMKALGVTIFAVVFDLDGESDILQLYTDCASPGLVFDAVDSAALLDAFAQIGGALREIRLIR